MHVNQNVGRRRRAYARGFTLIEAVRCNLSCRHRNRCGLWRDARPRCCRYQGENSGGFATPGAEQS